MTTDSDIKVPRTVWYDTLDISPAIDNGAVVDLSFAVGSGTSDLGETTVLAASYKFGWPYTEMYGPQLPKPVHVAAINAATGAVYIANLDVVELYETDEGIYPIIGDTFANQGGPSQNAVAVGGNFNVDLTALLSLPKESAYYQVLLWLDDLVTPIQTVQVPANDARTGLTPGLYEVDVKGLISIKSSSQSPSPEPGVIRTDFDPNNNMHVYGTLPAGSLDTAPTGGAPGTPVLTVLTMCRQTQSIAWATDSTAYTTMQSSGVANFDFDPFKLMAKPDPAANVYVVTVLGNLRNEVLPLLADYQ